MTEETVAALDAYPTAKPDEPTFTLQGGDPLAAPLVQLWAFFARVRAGTIDSTKPGPTGMLNAAEAAYKHSAKHDARERDSLLIRATAAEEVSWAMDAYVKGDHRADERAEATDTHLTELQRLDLHDLKVRTAQKLSNFRCELIEHHEALGRAGFTDLEPLADMKTLAHNLHLLSEMIEPRRIFKKDQ